MATDEAKTNADAPAQPPDKINVTGVGPLETVNLSRNEDELPSPPHSVERFRSVELVLDPPKKTKTSRSSRKGEKTRLGTFNPFELETQKLNRGNDVNLLESLKTTSAVEMCIEFYGMTRLEFFGEARCFVVLFYEGPTKGSWQLSDQSEDMRCISHMRCFKKFRLRAGTEVDRTENAAIALFASTKTPTPVDQLHPLDAWAYSEFTVGELLENDQMILEQRLKHGKKGAAAKGSVSLALDIIYHMEHKTKLTFDFGFLDGSPKRNRMFFEISKALRRGKWAPLYRSEVRCHDEADKFDKVTFNAQDFHGGDVNKLLRLELFRWYKNGKFKLLGFIQTTYEKLTSLKRHDQLYWWPSSDGISTAKVKVQEISVSEEECSFTLRMANMF